MTTLNLQVAASSDDAFEGGGGAVNITGLRIQVNATGEWAGFRFINVTIPQAATINSAVMQVYVHATTDDDPDIDIYGEAVDDAATFTTAPDSIETRPRTTAKTNWTATGVGTNFVSSPSLVSVIQEIVNRAGWVSGNDLVLIWDGLSTSSFEVRAYDTAAGDAAKLDIDYTAGAPPADDLATKLVHATSPMISISGG